MVFYLSNTLRSRAASEPEVQSVQKRASTQSGLAIGEMLVFTLPLCLLSLALISRLSTTASRRLDSLTEASVTAQRDTRGVDGCAPRLDFSAIPMIGPIARDKRVIKSLIVQAPAALVMLPTGDKTRDATAAASRYPYFYQGLAGSFAPDSLDQHPIKSSATFVCNEPVGDGEGRKLLLGAWVFGTGMWQARKLFTGSSGGGPKSEQMEEPNTDSIKDQKDEYGDLLDRGREELDKQNEKKRR